MNYEQTEPWQTAADQSEFGQPYELPPDGEVGERYEEGTRKWLRVLIVSGAVGGRWAYWRPVAVTNVLAPPHAHPEFKVLADKLFNGDAVHFVGMLAVPYAGTSTKAWVLVEPRMTARNETRVLEPRRIGEERYERSNEVYDVETGETRSI